MLSQFLFHCSSRSAVVPVPPPVACTVFHLLERLLTTFKVGVLKPFFKQNRYRNRFVETGYLPVIRLCDVMCHVAAVLERKAAGEVKRSYIITR